MYGKEEDVRPLPPLSDMSDSPQEPLDGLRVAPLGHLATQVLLTSSRAVLVHTVRVRGVEGTHMGCE